MKRPWIPVLAASLAFAAGAPAEAQRPAQPKSGAAAIVEGVVREVFRSPRRNQVDYLVQIDVRRSELGRGAVDARRLLIPAPGDSVYVHVSQSGAGDGQNAIPTERSSVRAYLYPRAQGGWDGASPDWFEPSNEAFANRGGDEPAPPAEDDGRGAPASTAPERGSILQTLGVKADQVNAGGRLVLKVTEVTPDSPAKKAGFEKGDVIIGANGQGFTSLEQLADLLRKGGPVGQLAVLNVQNGKQATVKIDVPGATATAPRIGRPDDAPAAEPKRSLGVTVEPKRLGLRTALEVTAVQPGGAAEKAGIEEGDVLVEADGVALTDSAQLQKVVDKSGSSLTIKVRDSRTGKDVPIEVTLAEANSTRPGGTPRPDAPKPNPGHLTSKSFGITTEAATADLLPVVKVVAVAAGSLAEKAGIEVGDAITGVDDKIIFAPDLLDEALGKVGATFTLTILDVKTGKKTPVQVTFGQQ
ncbi:MAG: PDZ domain-containing protein [Paludisphaera borealis]|uniref:PDZ domain-containing protein n=1 Tax=Paludisphaera borealis TaxID=1387353 RepID=UPI00284B36DC|nr:PDZ domain-containing protein [Paludisphaera borealis]MDR3618703.1 PDZ domain-containing protein [Paludisphaera borealis]